MFHPIESRADPALLVSRNRETSLAETRFGPAVRTRRCNYLHIGRSDLAQLHRLTHVAAGTNFPSPAARDTAARRPKVRLSIAAHYATPQARQPTPISEGPPCDAEHGGFRTGATIACMAKFKPAKGKRKTTPTPQGAIPCVILVILVIAAVMLMLVFVMKSFSGK